MTLLKKLEKRLDFFFKTFFSENFHFLAFNFSMHFTLELTLGFCSKIKPILLLFLKKKVFFKKNLPFFRLFQKPHFLNPMHKIIYLIVKIKKDTSDFKKKTRFCKKLPFCFLLSNYISMHITLEKK